MSGARVAVLVRGIDADGQANSEVVGYVDHVCALSGCEPAWNGRAKHDDGITVALLEYWRGHVAPVQQVCWLTLAEARAVLSLIEADDALEWLRPRVMIGVAGGAEPSPRRLDGGRP